MCGRSHSCAKRERPILFFWHSPGVDTTVSQCQQNTKSSSHWFIIHAAALPTLPFLCKGLNSDFLHKQLPRSTTVALWLRHMGQMRRRRAPRFPAETRPTSQPVTPCLPRAVDLFETPAFSEKSQADWLGRADVGIYWAR